jgi:hypothetical protein
MAHLTMQLKRSPEQQAALDQYTADLQNPASPNFHHWLSAQTFGSRYGLSASDIASVTNIDYGVDAADAHSGFYGAYLAGFGGVLDLSQLIATKPGGEYTVSFWLAESPTPLWPYMNSFQASFGLVNLLSMTQVASTVFTEYSFQAEASQASTDLQFGFRDDVGYFSLDDVSVSAAAVPEPAVGVLTAMLLLAGLGLRA